LFDAPVIGVVDQLRALGRVEQVLWLGAGE
jgi:hypothetical protein